MPSARTVRLPGRSVILPMPEAVVTRRLPPSRKVSAVKSTCCIRDSVLVVVPHSMSTVPLTTKAMRFSAVTLTHLTSSFASERSFLMFSATRRQRSIEYPCGVPPGPTEENGADVSV